MPTRSRTTGQRREAARSLWRCLVGIASALLLLRTGSIWPGVVVHAVNNGLGTVLEVIAPAVPA
ncbi:CPBP family intramembrane glutamic endopeptidase [Nonomuraea sp. NPDC046802]|uniref:CPBP family intramembrane glutamic endopeptidase n=1 Tax=Nonomuraea sp. NPDC046802 TaxID=3154919 RepID=UPI0033D792DE